jgi:3-hydroxyacyl-CoA dehydrogenase
MTLPSQENIAQYIAKAGAEVWKIPQSTVDSQRRLIQKVGVIGAGTMGGIAMGGIAMNFATAGIEVTIVEQKAEVLERGLEVVRGNYQRSANKGRFNQTEVEARMGRLKGQLSLEALSDCDLIIEAIFENMYLKRQIFSALDKIAKPGAIMATNTSALDIDEIASVTKRPQDVIGLHFFSPANAMKLLEIVRAEKTADDVVATSMDLAKRINKIATLVGVCPGFVGNRMLFARQGQGQKLLYKGVMPWDTDAAMNAFGFKMGNFQMSDLAGLDIGWSKGAKTDNPIRDALCEINRRGQKTKAGFYDYDASRTPIPSEIAAKIIRDITGVPPIHISRDQIIETCIFPMINEAVKILEENKVQRPSDIDVVWLNGYGWPADKGGPMYYADMVGAKDILKKMEELGAEDSAYVPAATLRHMAVNGGKFIEIDTGGLKTTRN